MFRHLGHLKINSFKRINQLHLRSSFSTKRSFTDAPPISKLRACVVGSGPAGFYAAEGILRLERDLGVPVDVDIIEKLPTPFGLVRTGVAPDHPEVKLVENNFTELVDKPNCKFFGNVTVGHDVTIDDLRRLYHVVVLAYGADDDRKLHIPGEKLPEVLSARTFVGWVNGHPNHRNLDVDLSQAHSAAVIGQGNVALDVARLLLKSPEDLASTDITQHTLDVLKRSTVRVVHLIGRRGPAQASFTTGELREVLAVKGSTTYLSHKQQLIPLNEASQQELAKERGKRRMWDLLSQRALDTPDGSLDDTKLLLKTPEGKALVVHFLSNPVEFVADASTQRLSGLKIERTVLQGAANEQQAIGTGQFETIPCQIAFRSIGYRSVSIPGVPFDKKKGVVPNTHGRVITMRDGDDAHTQSIQQSKAQPIDESVRGLYVSGWLKRGPSGIIGTNKFDAEETVQSVLLDIQKGELATDERPGRAALSTLLRDRAVRYVTFDDWRKIDTYERQQGLKVGKPREKISTIEEFFRVLSEISKQ